MGVGPDFLFREGLCRQIHALRGIADGIAFSSQQRPHQALGMMSPDAAYAAALTA